ncbi:MAG: hypothetical protein R3B84_15770 [Zavarzinella sp.]
MFRCSYILDGTGWATVSVSENDRQVAMTASYLHDSLRELSQAALDLCDGNSAVTVVFMAEPGEHHLIVTGSQNSALVDIEVRWFDDWASWNMYPADQFNVVFKCQTTVSEFASAVVSVLDDLLEKWGLDGYQKKWAEHPFPKELHNQLAALNSGCN